MARELMDMKIKTAHLRERLRLRVGGDTTAAELESEAFALQTALSEAQQTLKSRETELQALDLKYQKAMCGMMRLDEAWKLSKTQTREAQDAQQAAEQLATDEKQRGDELQREAADSAAENEKEQGAKDREMQVHELRAQLETMRHQFDTQMKQQEGAMREDVRRLQEELQKAEEQEELIQKQKRIEEELVKKKQAVEETEQRLTKESQGMLQAQEET
ncbi:hypothetical protein PC121_g23232, partial [Phytophthora cactorum]